MAALSAEVLGLLELIHAEGMSQSGLDRLDLIGNGENMDDCVPFHATENQLSIDSNLEMVERLDALRSLVCDLLATNQELRHALVEARVSTQRQQGPHQDSAPDADPDADPDASPEPAMEG